MTWIEVMRAPTRASCSSTKSVKIWRKTKETQCNPAGPENKLLNFGWHGLESLKLPRWSCKSVQHGIMGKSTSLSRDFTILTILVHHPGWFPPKNQKKVDFFQILVLSGLDGLVQVCDSRVRPPQKTLKKYFSKKSSIIWNLSKSEALTLSERRERAKWVQQVEVQQFSQNCWTSAGDHCRTTLGTTVIS